MFLTKDMLPSRSILDTDLPDKDHIIPDRLHVVAARLLTNIKIHEHASPTAMPLESKNYNVEDVLASRRHVLI